MQILEPEFSLSDADRDNLHDALSTIDANPYKHYEGFCTQVRSICASSAVPEVLAEHVKYRRTLSPAEHPLSYFSNLPIDTELPIFDFDDPVASKHALKRTFIGEGILALYAELAGTPGIAYLNVNDGDVFQDIYPKRSLADSQSQKALNSIAFHKDLANHFVRPDYVYMIGMRASAQNQVYTTFAKNTDIFAALNADQVAIAQEFRYITPFDDLTVHGNRINVGDAQRHPLIRPNMDLQFFENRTRGVDDEAQSVVDAVRAAAHAAKLGVNIQARDFVITCNNYCVHSKEVVAAPDEAGLQTRWVIKTVNVDTLATHVPHMVRGVDYLVRG